jgi:glycerate 2-kinase
VTPETADLHRDWDDTRARNLLRSVFDAAVSRADPSLAVVANLPEKPNGRCFVVGAGKASGAMAAALDAAWPDVDLQGVVVTPYGHSAPAGRIRVLEANHPVPDDNSHRAALEMLSAVQGLEANDLVIALISGGGSALLCLPRQGMDLSDKAAVHAALLRSGATIEEMNVVRSHLSDIKAGRLGAAAFPARLVTLVISDIPGDDPALIASGPTVPSSAEAGAARMIVDRYGIQLPLAAELLLDIAHPVPVQGAPVDVRLIATPLQSLQAAAEAAASRGVTPIILGDAIQGESREVGKVMAGIAQSVQRHGNPVRTPALLLSGGETTVNFRGAESGRGGRNMEFLLGFVVALSGTSGIWAIAGDTDGIDGSEDAAGAIVTPDTLTRGRTFNHDALLDHFDSYSFFGAIGDLVITGPTLTNVNDIRAVLIT